MIPLFPVVRPAPPPATAITDMSVRTTRVRSLNRVTQSNAPKRESAEPSLYGGSHQTGEAMESGYFFTASLRVLLALNAG